MWWRSSPATKGRPCWAFRAGRTWKRPWRSGTRWGLRLYVQSRPAKPNAIAIWS
jgi:hypothetical protein